MGVLAACLMLSLSILLLFPAEAARQAELARYEREKAEAEARAAEEIRISKMMELERMEMEGECASLAVDLVFQRSAHHETLKTITTRTTARKAEAEAQRVAQLAKIEEDRIQAERAIAAAQMAEEEVRKTISLDFRHKSMIAFSWLMVVHSSLPLSLQREKALREAEEERQARILALEQANEMKEAKAKAEHEAEQIRLARAASIAQRKELLSRLNRDMDEKARRVEELMTMLDEAKKAAKDAEIRALKAESSMAMEEERAAEKKQAIQSEMQAAVSLTKRCLFDVVLDENSHAGSWT